MRPNACILSILLFAVFQAKGTPGSIRADQNPASEEEIRSLEVKLTQQILSGDAAYGSSLAEDYVLVRDDGTTHTKAEMTARFLARDPANRIESMRPSNLRIRVYGETAVMNFELSWVQVVNGKRIGLSSEMTKVFIKRKGRWYMINNQGTPLPAPAGVPIQK